MNQLTILILYNATSTLLGKVSYSYRKLTCSKSDDTACAACDITHGGLHLDETARWNEAKRVLEGREVGVRQLHKDELDEAVSPPLCFALMNYAKCLICLEEGLSKGTNIGV